VSDEGVPVLHHLCSPTGQNDWQVCHSLVFSARCYYVEQSYYAARYYYAHPAPMTTQTIASAS
jgi:hypothetical protein